MSEQPAGTWEVLDRKTSLRIDSAQKTSEYAKLDLGIALKEYEKLENEFRQIKTISIKRWEFEKEEPIASLLAFVEEAFNKRVSSIESLQKYDLEFDEDNGLILVKYFFKNKLTLEEERKIAELEVLILERINVYRIEFHRIYKR